MPSQTLMSEKCSSQNDLHGGSQFFKCVYLLWRRKPLPQQRKCTLIYNMRNMTVSISIQIVQRWKNRGGFHSSTTLYKILNGELPGATSLSTKSRYRNSHSLCNSLHLRHSGKWSLLTCRARKISVWESLLKLHFIMSQNLLYITAVLPLLV